jgi:hypothetical protein
MKPQFDLTGQKFGRLTVIRPTQTSKNKRRVWECRCLCGSTVFKTSKHLKYNKTDSCGCLRLAKIFVKNTSLTPDEVPLEVLRLKMEKIKLDKKLKARKKLKKQNEGRIGRVNVIIKMADRAAIKEFIAAVGDLGRTLPDGTFCVCSTKNNPLAGHSSVCARLNDAMDKILNNGI